MASPSKKIKLSGRKNNRREKQHSGLESQATKTRPRDWCKDVKSETIEPGHDELNLSSQKLPLDEGWENLYAAAYAFCDFVTTKPQGQNVFILFQKLSAVLHFAVKNYVQGHKVYDVLLAKTDTAQLDLVSLEIILNSTIKHLPPAPNSGTAQVKSSDVKPASGNVHNDVKSEHHDVTDTIDTDIKTEPVEINHDNADARDDGCDVNNDVPDHVSSNLTEAVKPNDVPDPVEEILENVSHDAPDGAPDDVDDDPDYVDDAPDDVDDDVDYDYKPVKVTPVVGRKDQVRVTRSWPKLKQGDDLSVSHVNFTRFTCFLCERPASKNTSSTTSLPVSELTITSQPGADTTSKSTSSTTSQPGADTTSKGTLSTTSQPVSDTTSKGTLSTTSQPVSDTTSKSTSSTTSQTEPDIARDATSQSSFPGLHKLISHMSDKHVQKNEKNSGLVMQCPICPTLLKRKGTSLHVARELMSQLLVHLTCNQYHHEILHDWSIPDYVTPVSCEQCTYTTVRPGNLRRHVMAVHERREVVCDKCGKLMSCQAMVRHSGTCGTRCTCKVCGKAVVDLQTHMLLHRKDLRCSECPFTTKVKAMLDNHLLNHHGIKNSAPEPLKCPKCSKKYMSRKRLNEHLKSNHSQTKDPRGVGCPDCKLVFGSTYRRDQHIKKVHELPKFPCDQCNIVANTYKDLTAHKSYVHGSNTCVYKCAWCSYTTNDKTTVERHLRETCPRRGEITLNTTSKNYTRLLYGD